MSRGYFRPRGWYVSLRFPEVRGIYGDGSIKWTHNKTTHQPPPLLDRARPSQTGHSKVRGKLGPIPLGGGATNPLVHIASKVGGH